jgi:hypothetical protein
VERRHRKWSGKSPSQMAGRWDGRDHGTSQWVGLSRWLIGSRSPLKVQDRAIGSFLKLEDGGVPCSARRRKNGLVEWSGVGENGCWKV